MATFALAEVVGVAVTVTVAVSNGTSDLVAVGATIDVETSSTFNGDMTRSRTCITPLLVLNHISNPFVSQDTWNLHHILVDYLRIIDEYIAITHCDTDRFIREGRKGLTICEKVAIQRLDNCVKLDQALQIRDVGCHIRASCLQERVVIRSEASHVLSDVKRRPETCAVQTLAKCSHPPSTD